MDRAIAVASAAFHDALHADGRSPEVERTLRRYLVRMSTRPTPFGLFAGVALARWGDETDLQLRAGPRGQRTRPDMAWLMRIVDAAEADPEIRRHLRVVANRAAFARAGRVVLAERVSRGEAVPPAVSVRATGVVRRVLAAARTPVEYDALAAMVLEQTPGASAEQVEGLLSALCEQTLLLTDLRPPLTGASPARHVIDRLAGIPAADGVRTELEAIVAAAAEWDAAPTTARYRAIVERAATLAPFDRSPLHVDATLPLAGRTVSRAVAEEAARAAELLLRISPTPQGPSYLAAYRRAFEARYGLHREVPLLELLDPDAGLGPPRWSAGGGAPQRARAEVLIELATTALRDRTRCVELDERTIERLQPAELSAENAPASLDLQVTVAAPSREALDAGDFRLVIGSNVGSMGAGRTLGRFADLLPEAEPALRRIAAAEETAQPGRLWAELTYAPRAPRLGNVSIRPNVRGHEIAVGVTPGGRTIPVDELLVGVRGGRFYVRWEASGQELAITAGHMLNHARAPVLCRFLSGIGRDSICHLSGFQWGPAAAFPFLPRVQSGRTVLALARWRLTAQSLPVERWRELWDVPRHVALTAGDSRLPLDLEVPEQADELRRALRRGPAVVTEVLPGAWLQDTAGRRFASELVVPLIRRTRAAAPPRARTTPRARDLRPPGGDWLFVKLYCGRDVEEDVLAGPVRELAAGRPDWFFIRYSDPGRHLRLRFHGDPDRLLNELLPRVCAWAGDLIESGTCSRLAFDTYEREVERFGGPEGMAAAEAFFAADSRAAVELLAQKPLASPALAALTVEALLAGLGLDRAAQVQWCAKHSPSRRESGADYRAWKATLRPLLAEPPAGEVLADLRAAAATLGQALDELAASGRLTRAPQELYGSLVHLHLNRLLGADSALERRVIGLLGRIQHGLAAQSASPGASAATR